MLHADKANLESTFRLRMIHIREKELSYFVHKRMKIAGCMLSADAHYDPLAEVHVPDYCAIPLDYRKGCLLPNALWLGLCFLSPPPLHPTAHSSQRA